MFENGFPKEWSTLRKLAWLFRSVINAVIPVLKTVTGNPIHILDALAKPAQALSVDIEPVQDLHGYDNPWPAGGGKNLLPTQTTVKSGGTYFIGDSTTYFPFKAGTYTASHVGTPAYMYWQKDGTTDNNIIHAQTNSGTFTLTEDCNVRFWFYTNVADARFTDIQIESGSTATAFAPYSNICPISGRTSATVTRTGKNLFDKNAAIDGKFINASGQEIASGNYGHSTPIKVKPNTKYCMTGYAGTGYFSMLGLDANMNTLPVWYGGAGKTAPFVATTPSNCAYIILNYLLAQKDSIAFYESDTVGEFIPYQGNTYTIQLGETVYGGTLDVTTGKMVVDRAMVDMGERNYTKGNRNTDNTGYVFYFRDTSFKNYGELISSQFKEVFYIPNWESLPVNCCNSARGSYIVFCADYSDAAAFKAAMNGVQLVYELATPIEITLTPTQIETLLGQNNIWSDAGDLTLTYYADGNASDAEALGILLGGRYAPSDDVTDKEALDIILGDTK